MQLSIEEKRELWRASWLIVALFAAGVGLGWIVTHWIDHGPTQVLPQPTTYEAREEWSGE